MAKRRASRRVVEDGNDGPNWLIIGGIAAVGMAVLLGLLAVTVTAGPSAPEPTPVLEENVVAIAEYCEANPDRCIAVGAEDAPVTLVEVSDYGCPHCRDFNADSVPTLKSEYVDTGLVRWVIMPYALSDQTQASAVATLCAADQGQEQALAFHEEMFKLQTTGDFNTAGGFSSVARNVGLDVDQFDQCVAAETYDSQVHFNRQAARQAGVNSTPTVFINGRMISGNVGLEIFSQRIEDALTEG
ncbi:MAG: DsbA family protein [Anaerolineales bacterium]|nr:DsbA family protein [Anaerolineales bacterium]